MLQPYTLDKPAYCDALPVVFDSPHSGMTLPNDFKTTVPVDAIKTGWDAYIDQLWGSVSLYGGSLLCALFSRMYIDPNRAPDDIDPDVVEEGDMEFRPSPYSARGMGLIRRMALPDLPLYHEKVSYRDFVRRWENYYLPYHNALKFRLDQLHSRFGEVWHVDCHSMKSVANKMNVDAGRRRPDIILGDNCGTTASEEFVAFVEDSFLKKGYSVVRNDPYKGGYLINQYSDVKAGRHSMQIEINRSLYMNERRFTKNDNYETFQRDIAQIAEQICHYTAVKVRGGVK